MTKRYEVIKSIANRPTKFTLLYIDFDNNTVADVAYFIYEEPAKLTAELLNRDLESKAKQKVKEHEGVGYDG